MRAALAWAALLALSLGAAASGAEPVARFPEEPAPSRPAPPAAQASPPPSPATAPVMPPPEPEPVRRPVIRSGAEELLDRGRRLEAAQRYTEAITAYSESIKLD